jgi:ABC-type nitrate/sulfonate/bicarbonate transport system ATPase subunit
MLDVSRLVISYRTSPVPSRIGPLSFRINAGETVGLLGPSGCGKSSIVRAIARIHPRGINTQVEGSISCLVTPGVAAKRSIMLQESALLPHLTVAANVLLPHFNEPARVAVETTRAYALLDELGLAEHRDALPETLSGGMKTRVALARALISQPDLLLLDEPFSGLDARFRDTVYRMVEIYQARAAAGVLLVTHDLEEAWRICTRIIVLTRLGRIAWDAAAPQTQSFPELRVRIIEAMGQDD